MKKGIVSVLTASLIAAMIAGCGAKTPAAEEPAETAAGTTQEETTEAEALAEAEPVDPSVDYTTGTPWLCSFLDGNVTEDTPVPDLKDDFYLACTRDGLLAREIPAGYNATGTQYDVAMQLDEDLQNLFTGDTDAESHDAQLALNLYSLYMDWDSRNAAGATPLKESVDKVEAIDSIDGLTEYLAKTPMEEQLYALFGFGIDPSYEDSNVYIMEIVPGGLLLSDSAEYAKLTDYGAVRKDAYTKFADRMLQKLGFSPEEAAQKIENCFAFETELAPVIFTQKEWGDPDIYTRINNHYTREQIMEAQGDLPILATIEELLGYPQVEDCLLTQPEWLAKLKDVYAEENLTEIKDYLIVHGVLSEAGYLDRECYEWMMECNNTIRGSSGLLPDETVFSSTVAGKLTWPVARLYTEKYLSQDDKDRISDLIEDIREEYRGIIEEADFLSEETKAAAIDKLNSIDKRVLWPDDWSLYDCEGLEIASAQDGGSLWEAGKAITRYNLEEIRKDYLEPVNKDKWDMAPTTFNCFYNPSDNSISIMGAFARGGIYSSDMSDEDLFARLGMVIGHEISHAFDSTGAQFDKEGNMNLWWTEEDYAAFRERNAKLVAYFDAIHPWEGQDYNASVKSGEACADMGGMKCMLRMAAKKEGFDYDKFFRSYADLWLLKGTLNLTYTYIDDVHPLAYLRVNCILQQYDEFLDFYGIGEGDGMYLAPENRVNIW